MSAAAHGLMTADEFLVWCLDKDERWELVSGVPVRVMTGATNEHDDVVVNLVVALGTRLRGGPCRPKTADTASQMLNGNLRRPDVTVDCAPSKRGSTLSRSPTAFFEVLSPSTRGIDSLKKPDEYRRHPTLRHFVMLDPVMAWGWVNTLTTAGEWEDLDVIGLQATIALPGVDVELPMSEVYEGIELET